jgi:hypothetical protein
MNKLERQATISQILNSLFTWSWVSGHTQAEEYEWHTFRIQMNEFSKEKQIALADLLDWQGGIMLRAWPSKIDPNSPFLFEGIARLKSTNKEQP